MPPVPNCAIKLTVTFCVQGAISPLLANVYLHYVFDLWAERWRRHEATGDMIIVRYADDIVEGIAYKPPCGEIAMCPRVGRMGPIK
jgi:hypothetical protein